MLLSCGIQNSKTSGTTDINRYAIPATTTACECKDTAGAKCVAWCTNVQINLLIRKERIVKIGSVYCPPNYEVLLLAHAYYVHIAYTAQAVIAVRAITQTATLIKVAV